MQTGLILFSIGGFLLMSLKLPEYGLIVSFIAQIFWFYTSYKAWKGAKQFGIFINTVVVTIIIVYGVLNYWVL